MFPAMRLRFIIRDLLRLTAVVALAVGWWLEHHLSNFWRSLRLEEGSVMIFNHNTGERVQYSREQIAVVA